MSCLKLSKLVINFTKAARCAKRQYHISANFKLHKLAHIQTFPPSATLHVFTHRAPVSILLLSSACFGFTGSYFSISIPNKPSVGTHCPYTAQVQTHMLGHKESTTAAGATTLSSRTCQEGWAQYHIPLTPPSLLLGWCYCLYGKPGLCGCTKNHSKESTDWKLIQ